jgi:hypothetical protein
MKKGLTKWNVHIAAGRSSRARNLEEQWPLSRIIDSSHTDLLILLYFALGGLTLDFIMIMALFALPVMTTGLSILPLEADNEDDDENDDVDDDDDWP